MKQKNFRQTRRSVEGQGPVREQTGTGVRLSHDDIAWKAYLIYVSLGYPEGNDLQHWLEAEAQTLASPEPRMNVS